MSYLHFVLDSEERVVFIFNVSQEAGLILYTNITHNHLPHEHFTLIARCLFSKLLNVTDD